MPPVARKIARLIQLGVRRLVRRCTHATQRAKVVLRVFQSRYIEKEIGVDMGTCMMYLYGAMAMRLASKHLALVSFLNKPTPPLPGIGVAPFTSVGEVFTRQVRVAYNCMNRTKRNVYLTEAL